IYSAGNDLLDLINDILDLSKIEAGRMDIHPEPAGLVEIEHYVLSTFHPLAEEQGLDLVVNVEPGLPAAIETDVQRLHQVLKNLLSNAFKFTQVGGVTLDIRRPHDDELAGLPEPYDTDKVVTFSVTDTGIGVPTDKLKLIFEAFQQGDGTTSRKYGGTGLGLSISREIARLLGSSIAVHSVAGAGSTFSLSMPVAYAGVRAHGAGVERFDAAQIRSGRVPMLTDKTASVPVNPQDPLHGASVLIVDDDVRNVFALTSALELHGMTVLYADNGKDGIRILAEQPGLDLVLMDVMMPDMDGNQTTKEIRDMKGCTDLPVLFLTAKAMPGDRDKSLAAGASDYITKPVDLDRLLTVMRSWLVDRPRPGRQLS
ncbi:MAG: response regulator, partial [Jatrophihabitantaceae bacterium]